MELIGNMRYHYFTTITKMDWKCKYKSKRKKKFPAESEEISSTSLFLEDLLDRNI